MKRLAILFIVFLLSPGLVLASAIYPVGEPAGTGNRKLRLMIQTVHKVNYTPQLVPDIGTERPDHDG